MARETASRVINAPAAKVWEALADFSNIQLFHPNVEHVDQLSESDRGLGAARRCNFYSGGSAVETITGWDDEGYSFACDVTEVAAPLRDIKAGMRVEKIDDHRSKVHMEMTYVPKWGILGNIMNVVMLRFVLQATFSKVLKGLQLHLDTGEMIGKKGKPIPGIPRTTSPQLR